MLVRIASTHVLVSAPAKLNLFLEVLARRSDGFHEIETLMAAVTVYDTLEFVPSSDTALHVICRWTGGLAACCRVRRDPADSSPHAPPASLDLGDLPQGEKNLVHRAVSLLRERSGTARGGTIRLIKRIPSGAGLGGASSDAAAALVAANVGWELGWPRQRLAELAAELGSDVPFFLGGGWAICRGRGEQVEPVAGPRLNVVVVRPPVGLSTPEVYRRCRPAAAPTGTGSLLATLAAGKLTRIREELRNDLEGPAEELSPWIGRLREALASSGCVAHQMSGSGSSYFGIFATRRQSLRAASRLRGMKLGIVFQATTTRTAAGEPV